MDVDTTETPWRIEVSADSHMSDFDGRYVVVSRKGESVIYDLLHLTVRESTEFLLAPGSAFKLLS